MFRFSRFMVVGFLFLSLAGAKFVFAQPLTGTKSIGGSNPDFATIHDAVNALDSIGVGIGGVTFRIRNGVYNETPLSIYALLDSTRPALFTIDSGAEVTLDFHTSSAQGIVFYSNYVTFDGSWQANSNEKHLSIIGYISGVWFNDGSYNNTVTNCNISIQTTTTGSNAVRFNTSNNRVLNCDITSGMYGVYINSSTTTSLVGNIVRGCNITNFSDYGFYLDNCTATTVANNTITSEIVSSASRVYGIYLGANAANSTFNANQIGPFMGNYVFGIYSTQSSLIRNNLISNNMVRLGEYGSQSMHGFRSHGNGDKYLFNTVYVTGTSTSNNSSCYFNDVNQRDYDTLSGNIFVNYRTGSGSNYHACLYVSNPLIDYCDYNVYSVGSDDGSDNHYIARFNSVNYNTLSELRSSAWDVHDSMSYSVTVPFVSDSNLHIQDNVPTVIESGALRNNLVLTDFDGDVRSSPMCDIGADEGNFRWLPHGILTGTVRDSTSTRPPVPGVLVRAGTSAAITDSSGFYTLNARVGTYNIVYSKQCFENDTVFTVQVDSATTDTINTYLLRPEIGTDYSSLEFITGPGEIHSTTLILMNTGTSVMNWQANVVANPHPGGGTQNWLSLSPQTGTIPAHQIQELSVQADIDSGFNTPVDWTGTLTIITNACPETLIVPITAAIINGAPDEVVLPHEYKLYPTYPNPFNASATIRFAIPKYSNITCTIYDVTGRNVKTLLQTALPAGVHEMRFDGTRLASGTYFVRLSAGKFVNQQKIVLLK